MGAVIVKARFRQIDEPVGPTVMASAEARALALSYVVEDAVESGRYRNAAEVARALGLTRSRLSQAMRGRWMPVAEQERVLCAPQRGGLS